MPLALILQTTQTWPLPALTAPGADPAMDTHLDNYRSMMNPVPTFYDDFDGGVPGATLTEFDRTRWVTHMGFDAPLYQGDGARYLSGNGELQYYGDKQDPLITPGMPDPFSYGPSVLRITGIPSTNLSNTNGTRGHPYLSGCISTVDKWSQAYGLFEAKLRLSRYDSFWVGFWLLTDNPRTWPPELTTCEYFVGGEMGPTRKRFHTGRIFNHSKRSNTCQAAGNTTTTVCLDAGASATNNTYNGNYLLFTGGTGAGQMGIVTAYNGTTKIATVTAPVPPKLGTPITVPADGTTTYNISGGSADASSTFVGTGGIDLSQTYNIYSQLWTADQTIQYFNGKEVFRFTNRTDRMDMLGPVYMIVQNACGGNWMGPTPPGSKDCIDVDWVRAYQWAGTMPTKPFLTLTVHANSFPAFFSYRVDTGAYVNSIQLDDATPVVIVVGTSDHWATFDVQNMGGPTIIVDSVVHNDGTTFTGPVNVTIATFHTFTKP